MARIADLFKRVFGRKVAPPPEMPPLEPAEDVLERPPVDEKHKPPVHLWAFERERLPDELAQDSWNTVY